MTDTYLPILIMSLAVLAVVIIVLYAALIDQSHDQRDGHREDNQRPRR